MNPFLKTIKDTFLTIYSFVNEVQEIGCIKKSCFSYDLVSSVDDVTVLLSYSNSVKKLCENLQDILKELQDSSLDITSNLIASNHNQGTSDEKAIGGPYTEQNVPEVFPQNTYMELHCSKTDKFKEQNAFQPCQTFSQNSNLAHFKSDLHLPGKETSKQFNESLSYQETVCPSNSLVGPFENLALNPTIDNASLCDTASEQIIPTDNSTLPEPPSITHSSSVNSLCQQDQSISSQLPNPQEIALRSEVNQDFSNISRSCKKCSSVLASNHQAGSIRGRCSSCAKSKDGTKPKKRNMNFSHPCIICSRVFKTWKHLSIHMKKVHNDEEPTDSTIGEFSVENGRKPNLPVYCCKTCNSASSDFSNFQIHLCRLPNEEGNQADPNMSNRILITNVRKLQQMKKFVCDCCGVEFRALKRILYHLPRCFPGPYPCNSCSSIFLTLKDLNYHKKKNHRGEKCFTCDECGRSFLRKASLRKHCINRHESKAFLEAVELKNSVCHKCDLCPKKFIKKIFLTNHKLRMHGMDKKFLCQVCGKKFMTNNSLMIHMDIHKGEKKFECKYCDRRFRRKEKLLHHERIHTGERPYECDQCEKAFVSKPRLNEHLRRHEAEKRFECPECDKSYASAWDLKKHMRKKHNLEIATQYVKVILKRSDRFQNLNEQMNEQQHQQHPQQLPQLLSLNGPVEEGLQIPSMHGSQVCHMQQVIQAEQTTVTVPDTALSNIIHPSNTHMNVVPFAEHLQAHCLQRMDNETSSQPSLTQPIDLQSVRNSHIIYSAQPSSSQPTQLEDYSNS